MNLREIEIDIQELLKPIQMHGFGRAQSVQGARRKLKSLIKPFIVQYLQKICEYEDFILRVEISLKDFSKRSYDKVGGSSLVDKNDMIHLFSLEIDKGSLEKAYLGNKNVRSRLIRVIGHTIMHEILHMQQFENSKIPVNYATLDKDQLIKKAGYPKLRYYSDKTEIHAFALNAAQELYYSYGDVDKIKSMMCQTSELKALKRRSSAFWRYYYHIYSNIGYYPKTNDVWKLFLKKLVWYLDELYK